MDEIKPYRKFSELPEILQKILLEEQKLQNKRTDTEILEMTVRSANIGSGGVTWTECRLGTKGINPMDYQDAWDSAIDQRDFRRLKNIYKSYFNPVHEIKQDGEVFMV